MKTRSFLGTIKMAALAGVAAIVIYSCARDELRPAPEGQQESRIATVHFIASQAAGRAAFGEAVDGVRPTLWTANDSEVKLSLNYGGTIAAGVTPSADYGTASFSAEVDFSGLTPPYTYYVVSPASVAKALSPSREAWKVSIPCEQTPSATSPDEQGVILAAQSDPYTSQTGAADVDLYFNHLTAYGRVSLLNLDPGEATVQKVELTATTPFVGDWYWKCAATEGEHELIDYGASSTLTINTSRTSDIWFACAPVDMSEQMMVVTVYTDAGCFEQMVEFPANRKFEAGAAAVFSIDMAGAEEYNISGGSIASDPLLEHSNYGCYLGSGLEWEYNPGTDQVARSYDSSGVETYTLINPSAVEELEISGYSKDKIKGDPVSLSVNWRRGSTTVLSQNYTLKIIKEDGPKVWLGDGSGKGVIIKK